MIAAFHFGRWRLLGRSRWAAVAVVTKTDRCPNASPKLGNIIRREPQFLARVDQLLYLIPYFGSSESIVPFIDVLSNLAWCIIDRFRSFASAVLEFEKYQISFWINSKLINLPSRVYTP